jgi:hypothetical protein
MPTGTRPATARSVRIVAVIVVAACAHAIPPRSPMFTAPHCTTAGCRRQELDRVAKEVEYTEYPDRELAAYIARVGARIAPAAGAMPPLRYRVIDDVDAQAEAWPDGEIYVYRGALQRLRSEAELAALLGHEIGHVLGDPGDGHVRSILDQRAAELHADDIAVGLTAQAGYDPAAVVLMLRAIGAEHPTSCDDAKAEHPCMIERIARVHAQVAGLPAGELGVERFDAAMANLVSGDDPFRVADSGGALVFGHAGLALEPRAPHTIEVGGGHSTITFDLDVVAVVTVISAELGAELRVDPPDHSAVYVGDHAALWILVVGGADPTRFAAGLVGEVRAARAADLATLRPTRVDLSAPRTLLPMP